jgi:site-specific DNA recombinase
MRTENKTAEVKYFAYCRKSSEESSQRQTASIGDQKSALNALVEREGLNLIKPPFTEEKSAKDPGRPIFNDVLDRIGKGEADALICWDIDRLSRNPIDNGRLQWMLQKGVIKVIKTPGRSYFPEDAGLLMSIEGGRSTDYVMRLSKNVKRGLNSKAMKGWRPSGGPIGYLNHGMEKGSKTIISDPDRFPLVRKMWDLFLTGTYSVSKIQKIATNEWGLRTLKRRKVGGNPLTMSHMYKIFNDPFYYGSYPWTDPETGELKMIKGNHEEMITEKEYRRAQILLGKKGKPQPQTKEFAFTGLMQCGECQSSITAEEKNQTICTKCKFKFSHANTTNCPKCLTDILEMQNPKILKYIYYHCTKKKNPNCTQKYIKVEDLESQFNIILGDSYHRPGLLKACPGLFTRKTDQFWR